MSESNLKYILSGLGIAGAASLLYYILTTNGDKKSKNDEDIGKKKTDTHSKQVNTLDSNDIKLKDLKKLESKIIEDNTNSNSDNMTKKENYGLLDIGVFSELFKRVANYVIEQIFFSYEMCRQDFDKNGKYIGSNQLLFDIPASTFKNEVLLKIANENYKIISLSTDPNSYNKSLQYYLNSNK